MGFEFTRRESSILYGLLAEGTTDIILKTDCDGFVRHASSAIEQLGFRLSDMLVWPHVLDLVDPAFRPAVAAAHRALVKGGEQSRSIEFASTAHGNSEQWFAIQMRSLADERDEVYGVLSILRSLDEARTLKDRLFVAEMADPLTRLTNRRAFIGMLRYLVQSRTEGWLARFDIDFLRAINMRHGLSTGDAVLLGFTGLLQRLTESNHIISKIGGKSFGILVPGPAAGTIRELSETIVADFSQVGFSAKSGPVHATASGGVVKIGGTLDETLKLMELTVLTARAKGGNRVEVATGQG